MGLGKTVQALSLLLKVKTEHGSRPVLVVAPTSVLPNWEREIERFALSSLAWCGTVPIAKRTSSKLEPSRRGAHVLRAHSPRHRPSCGSVKFRTVILDEAQNIKNADSATAQACKTMGADHKIALTGTPLENRLTELWSFFDFLMPGFLGNSDAFHERFEHPIMVQGDMETRERLKKPHSPVHPSAPQDRGREGSAAQDRGRHLGRHGRGSAGAVPRGARGERNGRSTTRSTRSASTSRASRSSRRS